MIDVNGKNYIYKCDEKNKIRYIYDNSGKYIGSVWIDESGAWNPLYFRDVKYIPINSALKLLEYLGSENNEVE